MQLPEWFTINWCENLKTTTCTMDVYMWHVLKKQMFWLPKWTHVINPRYLPLPGWLLNFGVVHLEDGHLSSALDHPQMHQLAPTITNHGSRMFFDAIAHGYTTQTKEQLCKSNDKYTHSHTSTLPWGMVHVVKSSLIDLSEPWGVFPAVF